MAKNNLLVTTLFAICISTFWACTDSGSSKKTTSDTATVQDSLTSRNERVAMAAHNEMIKKLMHEINTMTMTGDPDLDFATMMMTHHSSGINMAEMYIPNGKDEKIRSMAQQISDSHTKQIEDLQNLIATHNTGKKKDESASKGHQDQDQNELMEAMNSMIVKLSSMQMSGDADTDFLKMMVPHHETAVMMAQSEISRGAHPDFKKMAQKIMIDQNLEIKRIQDGWLKPKEVIDL